MKFKLDENLGQRGQGILRAAGHDVSSVPAQGMQESGDAPKLPAIPEQPIAQKKDLPFSDDFGRVGLGEAWAIGVRALQSQRD